MLLIRPKVIALSCAALLMLVPIAPAYGQLAASEEDKARKEAELTAVQEEISSRLAALKSRQKRLSQTEQALQDIERKTATLASRLQNTRNERRQLAQRIESNQAQQTKLRQQQRQQAEALEQQVANAYTNGEHDFLKLLLNQQDPSNVERMLSYYHYFNKARITQIEQLKATTEALAALERTLTQQHQQLADLLSQQERQQQALLAQQREQESLITELQQQQRSDKQRLQALEESREQLEQVISAIEAALKADVQLVGLAPVKSRLQWPTDGRVKRLFGTSREGPLRWKGVMIEGNGGQPVRAIADGRILFADWLRGFGLVTVVDHGEGYMSLYGHNQTLLREVGTEVKMGEEIALMGQSGGRSEAALYFEIRYRGEAQNPTRWIN